MAGLRSGAAKTFPWVGCWLAVGIGLRLYHYLRDPPVWHDEAALVLNVLGRDFLQLLGRLRFSEAAPPLFLWIEKAIVLALGEGTYALRLVPFAASCAALFGIVAVARRVLAAEAVPWTALLVACSDRLLWHSCEAKPYAVDALVATGLVALIVLGARRPLWQQLLLATGVTPFLICLSYPACFLLGGLALAWLPALWRSSRAGRDRLLYAAFLAVLGVSFLLLLRGPIHAQRDDTLRACWQDMFPPWDRAWNVPGWLSLRLLEVARYAEEPVGNMLACPAVIGAVLLWRQGRRRLVAFVLAPVGLASVAALLGQYPVGATRVMVFAAPGLLLLTASGLPPALAWVRRIGRPAPVVVLAVALFPVGQAVYRVVFPWERAAADRAAAYVESRSQPGEAILGTNWEHDYYFRNRGATYQALDRLGSGGVQTTARFWLVAAGKRVENRDDWLGALPGTWHVLERRDFAQTSVFHLEVYPLRTRSGPTRE